MSVFRIQDMRGNIYLEDLLMRQVSTPVLSLTRQHIVNGNILEGDGDKEQVTTK